MNETEVAKVLAKIQLGDNRQADRATLAEWMNSIGYLEFEDAITAVTMHRRESLDYLQPAHIIRNVRRIIDARVEAQKAIDLSEHKVGNSAPLNFEAMSKAWNDPVAWAREVGVYHQQLRDAGEEF